jgi:hypothetical protein
MYLNISIIGMVSESLAGLELEDEEEWLGISFINN